MANEKNLIPNDARTPSERRANARKAGMASGASRRAKKEQKAIILNILSLPLKKGSIDEIQTLADAQGANLTVNEAIVIAQISKALRGDTKAAQYIRDTAGQNTIDNKHLDLEKKRLELEVIKLEQEIRRLEDRPEDEHIDNTFVDALNRSCEEVYADGCDAGQSDPKLETDREAAPSEEPEG
ncbi:MAG: hypothetical protein PUA59_03220 [Clostridium sp.]|nr:hypothetical protein [Clostridium sp.]